MMAAPETPQAAPLRVLFSMRNFWYVRIFESVIRDLAGRGHAVHICAEHGAGKTTARDWNDAAASLAGAHANVTFEWLPKDVDDVWLDLRSMVHLSLDYLRFFEPEYADAPILGARARERTPAFVVGLADLPVVRTRAGRRMLAALIRTIERALPVDRSVADYIRGQHADILLISPLLTLGSEQHDVLRTARLLGVPSVLCVGSWDHLSSKALVRQLPDRVFVWNDTQKQEAMSLHGVPPDVITVTGAQCFDQWFDRQPTLSREAFCRKVGLDPARPVVLYVCSALFEGSPSEAEWVMRWIAAVRASGDVRLADAGILVRPHPKRGFEWESVATDGLDNVSLWPPVATAPFQTESKADYFDSMFHSSVVVGLNTSALIEAGIVGRAVHTLLLPEFEQNQEGTLHFHYLLDQGLLRATRDLAAHVSQLAESVQAADPSVHHNRSFIERFVRPHGMATSSTDVFADAVERVAGMKTHAAVEPGWLAALRVVLTPLAWYTRGSFSEQADRARRRRVKAREREEARARREAERAGLLAERQQQKQQERAAREATVEAARRAKQATRDQAAQARQRARDEWQSTKRRQRQRLRLNARVVDYYRRLIRPFTPSR